MSDYETDFYAWTQQQAQALRARDWGALDPEHLGEEIEDLWKHDEHHLTMLILAFLELVYRPCAAEEGRYYWQASVIAHYRAMLAMSLEDSPRVRPLLEGCLPEAYAWARDRLLRRQTPSLREPQAHCPWPLEALLDDHWWPPEAPARLP
jgi:hypothetical protein